MNILQLRDWKNAYSVSCPPLRRLMMLCLEYSDALQFCDRQGNVASGNDIAVCFKYMHRIVSEYHKVIEANSSTGLTLKQIDSVKDDIKASLAFMFADGSKGLRNLQDIFESMEKSSKLNFSFPIFRVHYDGFIETRVFDSFCEAHLDSWSGFYEQFKILMESKIENKKKPFHEWEHLLRYIPDKDILELVEICYEYEEFVDGLIERLPSMPRFDVERLEKIEREILRRANLIIGDKTYLKELTEMRFLIDHIFFSINETVRTLWIQEYDLFVLSTVKKAKIYPDFGEKPLVPTITKTRSASPIDSIGDSSIDYLNI